MARAFRWVAALLALAALASCGRAPQAKEEGSPGDEVVLTPEAAQQAREDREEEPPARSSARAVELKGAGVGPEPGADPRDDAPSPGAPTDSEVRAELKEARTALTSFKRHLETSAFLSGLAHACCPTALPWRPRTPPKQ